MQIKEFLQNDQQFQMALESSFQENSFESRFCWIKLFISWNRLEPILGKFKETKAEILVEIEICES